jgi:hypothetical protein
MRRSLPGRWQNQTLSPPFGCYNLAELNDDDWHQPRPLAAALLASPCRLPFTENPCAYALLFVSYLPFLVPSNPIPYFPLPSLMRFGFVNVLRCSFTPAVLRFCSAASICLLFFISPSSLFFPQSSPPFSSFSLPLSCHPHHLYPETHFQDLPAAGVLMHDLPSLFPSSLSVALSGLPSPVPPCP